MADHGDERFVERLRAAWGRPELDGAARAVFDTRLHRRIDERAGGRGRRWLALPLAAATVAAVAVVWLAAPTPGDDGAWLAALVEARMVATESQDVLAWASGARAGATSAAGATTGDVLPGDYAALAMWLAAAEAAGPESETNP